MAVTIRLFAMYELTADGTGATGLTVTVDVDKFAKSDGTRTRVTTGGSATEGANGIYHYAVAAVDDLATHDYIAVFKTAATTVKTKHFAFLLQDLIAAATQVMANLDAAVTSRLAGASYTAPPTAAANADAVWDEAIAGHAVAGSTGAMLSTAGAATDPLLNAVPGAYVSGTAGAALGRIATTGFTLISQVATNGDLELVLGDDYLALDNRALGYSFTTCPVLTGATIVMRVQVGALSLSFAGTVTGAASCRVELTSVQLATIGAGVYSYDLQATLTNGHVVTLVQATMVVSADV